MKSRRPNGCLDACCRAPRDPEEFDPDAQALDDSDVAEIVKLSSVGVLMLVIAQIITRLLWELASIIPGFALFDGAPSTYSAYTHLGWWLNIDTLTYAIGLPSVYFALNYASENGALERGADRTLSWLRAYMFTLVFAMVGDVVHAGFSVSEAVTCDSTLCTQNQWALILLIVILFVRAILHGWNIYRVYVFRSNLSYALAFQRIDLGLSTKSATTDLSTGKPAEVKTALLGARVKGNRHRVPK